MILYLLVFAAWIPLVGAQPALVKDINVSPRRSSVTAIGNVLYFSSVDDVHGEELWRSNGTAAGTVLVKDIDPGSGSSLPSGLTNVNGVLYFVADNGVNGNELWRSNGTAAGAVLVKDIWPGSIGSIPDQLTNVNGVLYFRAFDGVHGQEVWRFSPP